MIPRDRELLTGMGNCFEACHADFAETVHMVASSRRREPAEVRATLERLRAEFGSTEEYRQLRRRLPDAFPM